MPDANELLLKEDQVKIKSCIYALQRDGLPPVTTHNVIDDYKDPVLNALRRCRLFNTIHDRVKVLSKFNFKSFFCFGKRLIDIYIIRRLFFIQNFCRRQIHCLGWTMKNLCVDVILECFRVITNPGATRLPNVLLWEYRV